MLSPAPSLAHCQKAEPPKSFSLQVNGMTCAACSTSVESILSMKMPSVEKVKVDLFQQCVTVHLPFTNENDFVKARINATEIIQSLGFSVMSGSADWRCRLVARKVAERCEHRRRHLELMKMLIFGAPICAASYIRNGKWISLAISFPFHMFAAKDVYLAAQRSNCMERLVCISVMATLTCSLLHLALGHEGMFDCAALTLFIFSIGKHIEFHLRRQLLTCEGLLALLPERVKNSKGYQIPLTSIKTGDMCQLDDDSVIPIDGKLKSPDSVVIDESSLTGECLPIQKFSGDAIWAGTRVVSSNVAVIIEAACPVEESRLYSLAGSVFTAMESTEHGSIDALGNEMAAFFIPAILISSFGTFLIWMSIFIFSGAQPKQLLTEYSEMAGISPFVCSLQFALSLMCVACPCALSLATPLAGASIKSISLKWGILTRDAASLYGLCTSGKPKIVLFDKTGTLTEPGQLEMTFKGIDQHGMFSNQEILQFCQVLEASTPHPMARSIVQYCDSQIRNSSSQRPLDPMILQDSRILPEGGIEGKIIFSQRPHGISIRIVKDPNQQGSTVLIDGEACGHFTWQDELRMDMAEFINEFCCKSRQFRVGILSGDAQAAVNKLRDRFPMGTFDLVFGDCSAQEKGRIVRELRHDQGWQVIYIGDGINDALAMAQADFSCSLGALATYSSTNILNASVAASLRKIFVLASALRGQVMFNFVWACIYNALAIPWAMGFFVPLGAPLLSATEATLLMSASGISILSSSLIWRLVLAMKY